MASKQPSIFDLMNEERTDQIDEEAEKRQRRKELLEPTGVKELFKEGKNQYQQVHLRRRTMQTMHQGLPDKRFVLGDWINRYH